MSFFSSNNCLSHATGEYDIWDIFQSKCAGSVTTTVVFQPEKDPSSSVQAANLPDEEEQAVVSKLSELADSAEAVAQAAGMHQQQHSANLT